MRVCVCRGECGCICMITICMHPHQRVITDCMKAINVNAVNDQLLLTLWPICMIIICMDAHQCVITDCNQCECLAISVYVWQSGYILYTKQILFFYYYSNYSYCMFSAQINHLYDV